MERESKKYRLPTRPGHKDGGAVDDVHIVSASEFDELADPHHIIEPGVEYQRLGSFARVLIAFDPELDESWDRLERWLGILPVLVKPPGHPSEFLRMSELIAAQVSRAEGIQKENPDWPGRNLAGWPGDVAEIKRLGPLLAEILEDPNATDGDRAKLERVAYASSRLVFAVLRLLLRRDAEAVRVGTANIMARKKGVDELRALTPLKREEVVKKYKTIKDGSDDSDNKVFLWLAREYDVSVSTIMRAIKRHIKEENRTL